MNVTKNIKQTCATISFVAQIETDCISPSRWENRIRWFGRAPCVWTVCHIACCNDETRAEVSVCAINCAKETYTKTTNNKTQIARRIFTLFFTDFPGHALSFKMSCSILRIKVRSHYLQSSSASHDQLEPRRLG